MSEYQKGDLEVANASYKAAKADYDRAERALAVARRDLALAERLRSEAFRALVEKTVRSESAPPSPSPAPSQENDRG